MAVKKNNKDKKELNAAWAEFLKKETTGTDELDNYNQNTEYYQNEYQKNYQETYNDSYQGDYQENYQAGYQQNYQDGYQQDYDNYQTNYSENMQQNDNLQGDITRTDNVSYMNTDKDNSHVSINDLTYSKAASKQTKSPERRRTQPGPDKSIKSEDALYNNYSSKTNNAKDISDMADVKRKTSDDVNDIIEKTKNTDDIKVDSKADEVKDLNTETDDIKKSEDNVAVAESNDTKEDDKKKSKKDKKEKKDKKDIQIEELQEKLIRNMAEFDNFRKRTEKEKVAMFEVGAKSIIEKILPVIDNFERGLDAVTEDEKDSAFVQGVDKIYKQFVTTLEEAGVKQIEAIGKEFNPDFHNAVMHIDDEEFGENIVAEEFQKGYMYRESVVRHSMVKVAN